MPRPRRSASWPSPRRCTWSTRSAPPSTRQWPWWPTPSRVVRRASTSTSQGRRRPGGPASVGGGAERFAHDEAVAMVADSVEFLRANDLRVFLDAEHFFDGYKANPEFTKRIIRAAEEAGAETLVLCDTNGGTLPYEVERIVADVLGGFETQIGVHFHNDSGCAVANSLAAVGVGATHVQGCVNGYGERAGNTDLSAAIPDLSLTVLVGTIPADRLELLTPVSHHIAELVNIAPNPQQPFVGASVFAHKAGLHTSAIARRSDAYEHITP